MSRFGDNEFSLVINQTFYGEKNDNGAKITVAEIINPFGGGSGFEPAEK